MREWGRVKRREGHTAIRTMDLQQEGSSCHCLSPFVSLRRLVASLRCVALRCVASRRCVVALRCVMMERERIHWEGRASIVPCTLFRLRVGPKLHSSFLYFHTRSHYRRKEKGDQNIRTIQKGMGEGENGSREGRGQGGGEGRGIYRERGSCAATWGNVLRSPLTVGRVGKVWGSMIPAKIT